MLLVVTGLTLHFTDKVEIVYGICVIASPLGQISIRPEILSAMCEVLRHRGPDEDGFFVNDYVGLGVCRLPVIDPLRGRQPVFNEDKSVVAVCNGEIYNLRELRSDLIQSGHKFISEVDTEILVHAYEEYGKDFVQHLDGMFAIAVWDQTKRTLLLIRDRLGIKPLYYFVDENRLIAASELKAILRCPDVPRRLDFEAIDLYLTFEYIPSPYSIFKNIRKLKPGHILTCDAHGVRLSRYWNINVAKPDLPRKEIPAELRGRLSQSVKSMLVSDVPLGAFLSGGIDSSSIVALMTKHLDRPVPTFSIGFSDKSYNELPYARELANLYGTEHHEEIITPKAVELVHDILAFLDEPLADFSIFPTFLVSQLARQSVTVVLSGDGGDELFGGYDAYLAQHLSTGFDLLPDGLRQCCLSFLSRLIPPSRAKKSLPNKARRFLIGAGQPADLQHVRWMTFLSDRDKADLYSEEFRRQLKDHDSFTWLRPYLNTDKAKQLNHSLCTDLKTYLVDNILVKVDRMSMANSLEVRVPFLSHSFVEFAMRIPGDMKIRGFQTKWVLKKAFRDKLPRSILHRDKQGFSIPMRNWLRSDLQPLLLDTLSAPRIERVGLFRRSCIDRWIEEHKAGTDDHSHRLWALMLFHLWYDLYVG